MTSRFILCIALLGLGLGLGCGDDDRAGDTGPTPDVASDVTSDTPVSDQCIAVESLVTPLSCVPATQSGIVCPGSCGQTLEGPVGVGLTTCRCVDGATGGLWECDLSACNMDGGTDAGVALDVAVDAGLVDGCPAAYAAFNAGGECTFEGTISETQFQESICDATREISAECSALLDEWLACAQTAPIVCEEIAAGFILPTIPSCTDLPSECVPEM